MLAAVRFNTEKSRETAETAETNKEKLHDNNGQKGKERKSRRNKTKREEHSMRINEWNGLTARSGEVQFRKV